MLEKLMKRPGGPRKLPESLELAKGLHQEITKRKTLTHREPVCRHVVPPSKRLRTDKVKAKPIDKQRGRKRRPREESSDDEDEQDTDGGSDRPIKRTRSRTRSPSPGSAGPADERGNDADEPADNAADFEDEADSWDTIESLSSSEVQRDCTFLKEPARLTVAVKVHRDQTYASRLGYFARFILSQTRRNEADGEDGTNDNVIGFIQAWRISKPTAQFLQAEQAAWLEEILSPGEKDP